MPVIGKKEVRRGVNVQIKDLNSNSSKCFTVHGYTINNVYDILLNHMEEYDGKKKID